MKQTKKSFGLESLELVIGYLPSHELPKWKGRVPLFSRISMLQKHKVPEPVIKKVMNEWERWRTSMSYKKDDECLQKVGDDDLRRQLAEAQAERDRERERAERAEHIIAQVREAAEFPSDGDDDKLHLRVAKTREVLIAANLTSKRRGDEREAARFIDEVVPRVFSKR